MKVALDATVVQPRLKGAGRVVVNLLEAFDRVDPASRYVALAFPDGAKALRERLPRIEVIEHPAMSGTRWELGGMGAAAAAAGADIVLTLREAVGFGGPPTVMHVAEPPAYRLDSGWRKRGIKHQAKDWLLQAALPGSIRRAAAVTAASQATASWLRDRYGVDAPVIPPGIDPYFLEPATDSVRDRGRYFLHPATGDRRDNTDLVLNAFALTRLPDVRMLLIGTPDDERVTLERRAANLDIIQQIEFVGWVSDERLRAFYAGAIALVHPTRYEGFAGLQALEAMAQGTPVIALRAPGVTEALQGAAVLLRAEDAAALAEALVDLSSNDHHRAIAAEEGRDRARGLTWNRAARRFVEVLQTLL